VILTDTSIVIEQARRPSFELQRVIDSGQAAVCGPVIAELYGGVRSEAERVDLEITLQQYARAEVDEPTWILAGRILGDMERRGSRVPFPDAVIAATAVTHGMPVWTRDQHFSRFRTVLPGLAFFDETTS
jgi:predicted nucleic acid-binding protein